MIALLQRVTHARVEIADCRVAAIDRGLLVFLGVERKDTEADAERLLERMLGYRIFPDAEGRMNLSLLDVQGGLLLVPQFTLAADTRKGMRPGFSRAAPPRQGKALFDYLLRSAATRVAHLQQGRFGADMQVSLCNDGPVTFWLQTGVSGSDVPE